MIYLYNAQGQPVPVEDNQVEQALASGQLGPDPRGVVATNPQGQLVQIPAEYTLQAVRGGYKLENWESRQQRTLEDKLGGPGAVAVTALTGVARGMSAGLSDVLFTETGMIDPKTLRQAREGYPTFSTGTEIAGAVGGALLTKKIPSPAGAISKIGTAVSKSVGASILKRLAVGGAAQQTLAKRALARVIGTAAGGAVEGALFGAGGAISEVELGQSDDLGEALVAHVGPAALAGGILGGGFQASGELLGAAAQKVTKTVASRLKGIEGETASRPTIEALKHIMGDRRESATSKLLARAQRKSASAAQDIERLLFEGGAVPSEVAESGYEPIVNKISMTRKEAATRWISASKHWGDKLGELRTHVDDLGITYDGTKLGDDIFITASKAAPEMRVSGTLQRWYNDFIGKIPESVHGKEMSVSALQELKQSLDAEAVSMGTDKMLPVRRLISAVRERVKLAQDDLMKKGLSAAEMAEYKQATATYALMADFAKKAKDNIHIKGPPLSFSGIARSVMQQPLWRVGLVGGGYSLGGAPGALAAGGLILGAGVAKKALLGDLGTHALQHKVSRMAIIQKAADTVTGAISTSVKRFLYGGRKTAAPASSTILNRLTGERDDYKAHKTIKTRLGQWKTQPGKLADAISMNLSGYSQVAPRTSMAATETLAKAIGLASTTLPNGRELMGLQLLLMKDDPTLNKSDLREFAANLAGVLDPMGTIDDIGNMTATTSQIKLFKQAWPRLAAKLEERLRAEIATYEKKLTYDQKFQLSVFLEQPLEYSLTPGAVRMGQETYIEATEAKPPPPKPSEQLTRDFAMGKMTPTQRLESAT